MSSSSSSSFVPQSQKKLRRAFSPVVESLERRTVLHAGHLHVNVNFQPAASAAPAGYVVDGGEAFAARPNGFSYGWDAANTGGARERNIHADQRYDTLNHTQAYGSRTWDGKRSLPRRMAL